MLACRPWPTQIGATRLTPCCARRRLDDCTRLSSQSVGCNKRQRHCTDARVPPAAIGAWKVGLVGRPRSGRPGKPADGEAPAMAGSRWLPNGCMATAKLQRWGGAASRRADRDRNRRQRGRRKAAQGDPARSRGALQGLSRRPAQASWGRRKPAPGLPMRHPRTRRTLAGVPARLKACGRSPTASAQEGMFFTQTDRRRPPLRSAEYPRPPRWVPHAGPACESPSTRHPGRSDASDRASSARELAAGSAFLPAIPDSLAPACEPGLGFRDDGWWLAEYKPIHYSGRLS